jgi:hypothetical protein
VNLINKIPKGNNGQKVAQWQNLSFDEKNIQRRGAVGAEE